MRVVKGVIVVIVCVQDRDEGPRPVIVLAVLGDGAGGEGSLDESSQYRE